MPDNIQSSWFESWFDSPYYHILYDYRDETEAADFIGALYQHFHPLPSEKALDLACGKGRHSFTLHRLGLDVIGVDLSEQNIAAAKKQEEKGLQFFRHDMREVFRSGHFDYVFNLFTSFGYFSSHEENFLAIKAASENLKVGGTLVIDYLNAKKVVKELPTEKHIRKKDYAFHVEKFLEDGIIHKKIEVGSYLLEHPLFFSEQVQAFTLEDFLAFFRNADLELEEALGDYQLNPFDEEQSDRLILVARKK